MFLQPCVLSLCGGAFRCISGEKESIEPEDFSQVCVFFQKQNKKTTVMPILFNWKIPDQF